MWRDIFYFSKDERRSLIILLCLIMVGAILLILKKNPADNDVVNKDVTQEAVGGVGGSAADTDRVKSGIADTKNRPVDRSQLPSKSSSEKPSSSEQQQPSSSERSSSSSSEKQPPSSSSSSEKKETTAERIKRLTSSNSRTSYPRAEKFTAGTTIELNSADTTMLKKIPGIGSAFAKRIAGYRALLGGYYAVTQLSEVYGIDEDKYNALAGWFTVDASQVEKLSVNTLSLDSLKRHPYIDYRQAKAIVQLRKQKGRLVGWDNFSLLDEFTEIDYIKLQHYLTFE